MSQRPTDVTTPRGQHTTEPVEFSRQQNSRPKVHLRIEPDGRYLRLANSVDRPLNFMVNQSDAERVQDNRGGFDGVIPRRHTLSIVGTEDDSVVTNRTRWNVVDFLAKFDRPIQFTPDWGWVTGKQSERLQLRAVDGYVDRVEFYHNQIEDMGLPVELRPLAKGLNGKHYRRAAERFSKLGVNNIALYGVQTPSTDTLVTRSEQAIAVFDPTSVMVIGRGSPVDVAKFPRRVNAIASWRNWMKACDFSAEDYSEEALNMWINMNERELQQGHERVQTDVSEFIAKEVKADG